MSISDEAVEAAELVLIAHQRRDNSSCLCGWAKLGLSHPLHQAFLALEAAAPHITGHAIAYLDEAGRMISTDPEVTDYERGFDDAVRGMSAKVKRLLNGEMQ